MGASGFDSDQFRRGGPYFPDFDPAQKWLRVQEVKGARLEEKPVPCRMNADLPASVRSHLPSHAQDIYREVFNQSFATHEREPDCEERAHKIAWGAVKRIYEKSESGWALRKIMH